MGDDEFHVPSGLAKSIKILDDSSLVASAIGLSAGFRVVNRSVYWGSIYSYKPTVFDSSPVDRIERYFMHYSPTMADSVWRSEDYIASSEVVFSSGWSTGNLGEFLHAFVGIVNGHHVIHPNLQWLRSEENPPQSVDLNRTLRVDQWADNSEYVQEHSRLINLLVPRIKAVLHCSDSVAIACFRLALASYKYSQVNIQLLNSLGLTPQKNYSRLYDSSLESYFRSNKAGIIVDIAEVNALQEAILSAYY